MQAPATVPSKRLSDEGSSPAKKVVKLSSSANVTTHKTSSKVVKLSASPKTIESKGGMKIVKLQSTSQKDIPLDGLDTTPEGHSVFD